MSIFIDTPEDKLTRTSYAARLPELCSSICQRLRGATGSSPDRLAKYKISNSGLKPEKPGTAIQNHQRQKNRRTLERVLTDEKVLTRRMPPVLNRSATESAIPGIKRELSETSLSSVVHSKLHNSIPKRYTQREVDLTAVSQATEAKLQRKAAVEQELKGAIAALKRPNPRLAVKELVESAEERIAGALSKSRSRSILILRSDLLMML